MGYGLLTVSYIGATILFILALGGLSNPETARRGNLFGVIGMAIALIATIFGVVTANYGILLGGLAIGGVAWVMICTWAGYFFGGLAWVRDNFELVLVAIVAISVLPMAVEFVSHYFRKKDQPGQAMTQSEAA